MKMTIPLSLMLLLLISGCKGNKQSTDDLVWVDVTANYPLKERMLQDFLDVEQAVKKEYDFAADTGFPGTDLVYDTEEKALFRYAVYNADFSTKETLNLAKGITPINKEIAFIQKLDAADLVEAYEKGQLKGPLKQIAAGLNEESNPVIMVAKNRRH